MLRLFDLFSIALKYMGVNMLVWTLHCQHGQPSSSIFIDFFQTPSPSVQGYVPNEEVCNNKFSTAWKKDVRCISSFASRLLSLPRRTWAAAGVRIFGGRTHLQEDFVLSSHPQSKKLYSWARIKPSIPKEYQTLYPGPHSGYIDIIWAVLTFCCSLKFSWISLMCNRILSC